MTTTVLSIDDMDKSFPCTVEKIVGQPTYATLQGLRESLKMNAASVPTTAGGGQHGYLGLVLSDTVYTALAGANNGFTAPTNPGDTPTIPRNATDEQIAALERSHKVLLRNWYTYLNVHAALKKQLVGAIEPLYLRAKIDRNLGYQNVKLRDLLEFLFTSYGQITPQALAENRKLLDQPWDGNSPFEMLIDSVETCVEFAADGNAPISDSHILTSAYSSVWATGLYFDDCKRWLAKPTADQTWDNFKLHFLDAQRSLRLQQTTTGRGGFINVAIADQENATVEALANLATATASDRQAFAALVDNTTNLTTQLAQKDEEIARLRKALEDAKRTTTGPAARAPRAPFVAQYCWTHGYGGHNGSQCTRTTTGHIKEATLEDNKGGCQHGKWRLKK